MPVLMVCFIAFLLFAYGGLSQMDMWARNSASQADQSAVSLMVHKAVLLAYLREHPHHSGVVPIGQLQWPTGFVANGSWSHWVEQGTLYVFGSEPNDDGTLLRKILVKTSESLAVGINENCLFVSVRGGISGPLPASLCGAEAVFPIPFGAIVLVGR